MCNMVPLVINLSSRSFQLITIAFSRLRKWKNNLTCTRVDSWVPACRWAWNNKMHLKECIPCFSIDWPLIKLQKNLSGLNLLLGFNIYMWFSFSFPTIRVPSKRLRLLIIIIVVLMFLGQRVCLRLRWSLLEVECMNLSIPFNCYFNLI